MTEEVEQFILSQQQCEFLARVFHKYDPDENGVIELEDLAKVTQEILGNEIRSSELQAIRLKGEGCATDGYINFGEFTRIMRDHMASTTRWGGLKSKLQAFVGFDSVQDQLKEKALKRGFEFNLMVVGESGLGKSTMINTLFRGSVSRQSCILNPDPPPTTVKINSVCHVIEEKSVHLKLSITDTPGFGDQINNLKSWEPILEYVNKQFEIYLNEEVSINRKKYIPDTRIHCCMYFIPPTGHCLRPLDIEFMKKLDKHVNIVPVIAKSDTLTIEERQAFKQRIRDDIAHHKIRIYPSGYETDEEDEMAANAAIDKYLPFAIIGSDQLHQINGKKVLARKTKWGMIEVENPAHCEFVNLRNMLIKTRMLDLKETTDKVHYENYRRLRLHGPRDLSDALSHPDD
eukprot:TRINITY_DN68_c2_g1_i1.p1 TRINITY_DN68_c2_g1~~TRINITY_DN68_c2_g1_i1.p1  ORF type:complete len:402 (-),score=106.19 TRINITY_DN68_c2_g1_i1:368-1573(-)